MNWEPPHDWRERWQPFAIALSLLVGIVVISILTVVALELMRLNWR